MYHTRACRNHTLECHIHTQTCQTYSRVCRKHTLRVKLDSAYKNIISCVLKSHSCVLESQCMYELHSACIYHTQACRNHTRVCRSHTWACRNHTRPHCNWNTHIPDSNSQRFRSSSKLYILCSKCIGYTAPLGLKSFAVPYLVVHCFIVHQKYKYISIYRFLNNPKSTLLWSGGTMTRHYPRHSPPFYPQTKVEE
jgi:hypothetical protein